MFCQVVETPSTRSTAAEYHGIALLGIKGGKDWVMACRFGLLSGKRIGVSSIVETPQNFGCFYP